MRIFKLFCALAIVLFVFLYGISVGLYQQFPFEQILSVKEFIIKADAQWDLTEEQSVKGSFEKVKTSNYGNEFDTVASLVHGDSAPLVVSLHTWSGNYLQPDPLALRLVERGYNYVRPNFQGPSNNENGCLSDKVISDIDSAIDWAINNGSVDKNAIYVIGVSGGGYTALGYASKSKHLVKHTYAWVPITDLYDWYRQSLARGNGYAEDILGCIGGLSLDRQSLALRSPINMPPLHSSQVSIYAGIQDGYHGSVPISHSINYFNNFADKQDRIDSGDVQRLLTRAYEATSETIEDRKIFIHKISHKLRLIVFDGGHEMLENAAFDAITSSINSN